MKLSWWPTLARIARRRLGRVSAVALPVFVLIRAVDLSIHLRNVERSLR
jgi:hypothetical protein